MGKPKRSSANGSSTRKVSSNKILAQDGKMKRKVRKKFTNYKCEYCDKKFHDSSGLRTHEKIHFNLEYPCKSCSYVAKTKKYLSHHMKQKHGPRRHECGVCGKAFAMPSMLREHSMVHTGEKPHECDVCGKRFRVTYTLSIHKLTHTNEKPFKCSFCTYACRDSSTLRRHEYRHMGYVRTFDCKICPKKFESKTKLKYHLSSVHLQYMGLELKKHKCELCSKTFRLRNQLRTHIEYTHDSSQACACPVCGRPLKHKRYLALHLRTHFDERPHACGYPDCGKRFKAKGDLKKHSIIHMPELHKSCPKCDMKFSRPERLRNHMKQHEPRKKSVYCDYCGVSFFTKNYLIKHITQKHCEEKQKFICDYCGLTTFNKPSIVMHIKYGQCQDKDLYCKICKYSDKYKNKSTLRSHYLTSHKMRYKPRKEKKKKKKKVKWSKERKPSVEIKVEPLDSDSYELEVSTIDVKQKSDIEIENPDVENDLLAYSKAVLSEDLQEYLLKDGDEKPESGSFDAFLLQHVFKTAVKREVEDKIETDQQTEAVVSLKIKDLLQKAEEEDERKKIEKKKKKEARLLEKKLRREAKLMRSKKRREKYELERVRLMYNERIKRAVEEAASKAPPKKITYFKKKAVEEMCPETEAENKNDNTDKNLANITNDELNNQYIETNNLRKGINSDDSTNKNQSIPDQSEDITDSSNNKTNVALNDNGIVDDIANDATVDRHNKNVEKIDSQTVNNENLDQNICAEDTVADIEMCVKDKDAENCSQNNGTEIDEDNNKNCQKVSINSKESNRSDEGNNTNYGLRKRKRSIEDVSGENSNDSKSDSDSDFEPNSGDESVPKKKMHFQTFQCYICFKLFPTKNEQISHCASHFDTCSTTQLAKCPVCGHVATKSLEAHVKRQHGVRLTLPSRKVVRRDDTGGSKYCYQAEASIVEMIPSVKRLNHQAAIDIDRKKRHDKDMTVAKTKLVKKGNEWILEKVKVDASAYQELPEFTDEELSQLPVSSSYTERIGQLGRLARSKGVRILYPCHRCDKICQNFAALRLHERRHDPYKKPFAPRKNKQDSTSPPPKEKPKVNLEHRLSKPQPIKNKHRCDDKLMEFYETHIRGDDIEFWQFLKIYNKMDRENINDFKDLEDRIDFGIHTTANIEDIVPEEKVEEEINNVNNDKNKKEEEEVSNANNDNNTNDDKNKQSLNDGKHDSDTVKDNSVTSRTAQHKLNTVRSDLVDTYSGRIRKVPSKFYKVKKANKRVILLSKKERMERERIKTMMREKLKGNV